MFQGTPFVFGFLHSDPSKPVLDKARPPKQALLQFSSLDGTTATACIYTGMDAGITCLSLLMLSLRGLQRTELSVASSKAVSKRMELVAE